MKIAIRRKKVVVVVVEIMILLLLLASTGVTSVNAEIPIEPEMPNMYQEIGFPDYLQISGRLEANGTHFELNNSEYLNVTLYSSEPISLYLESVPEMVILYIGPISGVSSTQITLGGFIPGTTYHKYEDDYHNHTVFITDTNGSYTYIQDISNTHTIFIQPRSSTKFIRDDMTGGDCTLFGVWNVVNKTCTMTNDLTQTIQIDNNSMILDGNNHTIIGTNTGNGIFIAGRNGIIVENLNVKNFSYGFYIYRSTYSKIIRDNISDNNRSGIYLRESTYGTLDNNKISNSTIGIYVYESGNSNLIDNNISRNWMGVELTGYGYNILNYNNISDNDLGISQYESVRNIFKNNNMIRNKYNFNLYGNYDSTHDNDIDKSNKVDGKSIYYLKGSVDTIYDFPDIGTIYCISCINVTIRDIDINNNSHGIYFWNTTYSRIENATISNNSIGISLRESKNNTVIDNVASKNYIGIFLRDFAADNILNGNNISNNDHCGIRLEDYSNNSTLTGNNVSNNSVIGIGIFTSDNKIRDNHILDNLFGVYIIYTSSGNNSLINNSILRNGYGLYLWSSGNNSLINNSVLRNGYGLYLSSSGNNTLMSNNMLNNAYGIYLQSSRDNMIYDNFFKNAYNFNLIDAYGNKWNITKIEATNIINGPNMGGNFWTTPSSNGFSETCKDMDSDGICDSNYTLATNNIDYLPLAKVVGQGLVQNTITVCPSGCDHASIQAAINAAFQDDIIEVQSGTYYENVNVNKQLILRGVDTGGGIPTVDAKGIGNAITLSTDGIVIEGFLVTNASGSGGEWWSGIFGGYHNNITIRNINASDNYLGIWLERSNNYTLRNNNVWNNYYGILLRTSINNTLSDNNAWNGRYGIELSYSSHYNTISSNNVWNNGEGISIDSYSDNNTLKDNNAWNNSDSISIDHSSNHTLIGNNASSSYTGIHILYSSKNTLRNNNVYDNKNFGFWLDWPSDNNTLTGNNNWNNSYGNYLAYSSNNTFYNNIFNNTNNLIFGGTIYSNEWNTTKQEITNIINGPNLGGNFWATPIGNGFSETCKDMDSDGTCDLSYSLAPNNTDYLPLAKNVGQGSIPNTITVCSSSCDFNSIQAAINGAFPGDIIEVQSSTYYENVNVNKPLTLRGVDIGNGIPVIDARKSGSAVMLSTDGIKLENFSLTNASIGVHITSNNNTIIRNNASTNINYGFYLVHSSNNILIDNNAFGNYYGINLYYYDKINLKGNKANLNRDSGIVSHFSNNNTVTNNNALNNSQSGIVLYFSNNNILNDNNDSNNYHGFYLSSSNNNTLTDNNAKNNNYGIYMYSSGNNIIYNNRFYNINNFLFGGSIYPNQWNTTKIETTNIINGPNLSGNFWAAPAGNGFGEICKDMDSDGICDLNYSLAQNNTDYLPLSKVVGQGSKPSIITVCSDNCDYDNIQAAVNIASPGDIIDVKSGTYYENVNINKQLIIHGNNTGGGVPIIDANGRGYGITLNVERTTIDNFTIVNTSTDSGIGIYVISNNNTITNSNVSNNYYGITLAYGADNNTVISNNVSNNYYGIILYSGNNTLINNYISNNINDGIQVFDPGNNLLTDNIINLNGHYSNNYDIIGYGIYIIHSNNNTLMNNNMTNNRYNFELDGWEDIDFDNNIDSSNTVNGKPIYYIKDASNTIYGSDTDAGTFYCINCLNVSIRDLNLHNNGAGIRLWNTNNSEIRNIDASNNYYGVLFYRSNSNNLNRINTKITAKVFI